MRTRRQILQDAIASTEKGDDIIALVLLEVFLDIRDLLAPPPEDTH